MKVSELIQHPLAQRAAIALYIFCVVGVISAYIAISTRGVQRALYFQGDSVLQTGVPNVMRGVYVDAPSGQFIHPSEFRFTLARSTETSANGTLVGQGMSGPGGFAHVSLDIPADFSPGSYDLILEANHPSAGPFKARQAVEVVASSSVPRASQWPTKTSRADATAAANAKLATSTARSETKDGLVIDVLPADQEVVRGLKSTIFIRTRDARTLRPVSASVRFQSSKGFIEGKLPTEIKTDRIGLARLPITPITDQIWQLEAETPDGTKSENEVRLTTVVTQFSIQSKSPVVIPGSFIEGAVYSLFEKGAFFIDLYEQNHRLSAHVFGLQPGGSGLQLPAPAAQSLPADIYRLQVYGDFYNPANSWDSVYLARAQDSSLESLREAATRTLHFVATHTQKHDPYFSEILADNVLASATREELTIWLSAFLLAIPRQFEVSPTLFNTQYADRAALEAWQTAVKADLKLLVAFILIIGVITLLYFTLKGVQHASLRSQQLSDIDLDIELETEPESEKSLTSAAAEQRELRFGEVALVLQGGILLLSLVLFALGVWFLLGYM